METIEKIIADLRNPDMKIKSEAASRLQKVGDAHAIERLISALSDPDHWVRQSCALALGRIGDERAVIPLIDTLLRHDSPHSYVDECVVDALGRIGDPRAINALISCFNSANTDLSFDAAQALGKIGTPAIKPLIAIASDSNAGVWNRKMAVNALGEIGDRSTVDTIIQFSQDSTSLLRDSAIVALAKIGDNRAVRPLISFLLEPESIARSLAAWALGQIGSPVALPELKRLARDDAEKNVRAAAQKAVDDIERNSSK